jgi:hypothetical protein
MPGMGQSGWGILNDHGRWHGSLSGSGKNGSLLERVVEISTHQGVVMKKAPAYFSPM